VSPDPRALVITGDGLNCERETAEALRLAGAVPELVHVSDVPERGLEDFRILVLIGGFSNGDHLGAGTVQASLFRHRLRRPLERFVAEGRLVLGVCNGFQTLVKMGLLPGADWERTATIMANDSGRFEDRWVHLTVDPASPCLWTRGLRRLYLPVRHGGPVRGA
jgi:phosphoribosylformylglycinamidine synthase